MVVAIVDNIYINKKEYLQNSSKDNLPQLTNRTTSKYFLLEKVNSVKRI